MPIPVRQGTKKRRLRRLCLIKMLRGTIITIISLCSKCNENELAPIDEQEPERSNNGHVRKAT